MGGIFFFQLRTDATLVIDGRHLKTAPNPLSKNFESIEII